MTFPHNDKDHEAEQKRNRMATKPAGRKQRYRSDDSSGNQPSLSQSENSKTKDSAPGGGGGVSGTDSKSKPASSGGVSDPSKTGENSSQTTLEMGKRETKSLEIPDPLVKYLQLKHREAWSGFIRYATSVEKFCKGFCRLLEILISSGDKQDLLIFNLVPIDLLDQCGIQIELENVKPEYSTRGSMWLGGDRVWQWRDVINEIDLHRSRIIAGLVRIDAPGADKKVIDEIENSPIVKKALELFGGKILGYTRNDQDGE